MNQHEITSPKIVLKTIGAGASVCATVYPLSAAPIAHEAARAKPMATHQLTSSTNSFERANGHAITNDKPMVDLSEGNYSINQIKHGADAEQVKSKWRRLKWKPFSSRARVVRRLT